MVFNKNKTKLNKAKQEANTSYEKEKNDSLYKQEGKTSNKSE